VFGEILSGIPQRLAYIGAGVCLFIAALLGVIAHRFFEEPVLRPGRPAQYGLRALTGLRFGTGGHMSGILRAPDYTTVHHLDPRAGTWRELRFRVALPDEPEMWALDESAGKLAWATSHQACAAAPDASPTCLPLPATSGVRALHLSRSGSLTVLFADGLAAETKLDSNPSWTTAPFDRPLERAVSGPGYLAVQSATERRASLYRLDENSRWLLVESRTAPEPRFRLQLAGSGQMAIVRSQLVQHLGEIMGAPGPVNHLAYSPAGALLAAGAFAGIHQLQPRAESSLLVSSPANLTALAASDAHLAYSGPDGTTVVPLSFLDQLDQTGQMIMRAAYFFGALAASFGIVGLLTAFRGAFVRTTTTRRLRGGSGQLPPPPPELIDALCSKGGVLWAGAGLSAQSGFPLWPDFIAQLIQSALVAGWIAPEDFRRLSAFHHDRDPDRALDELIGSARVRRLDLLDHYKSVYHRFVVTSRSHHALARLPLSGAITTNFDRVLETLAAAPTVIDDLAAGRVHAAIHNREFFLYKLYGELRTTQSARLCRKELYNRCAQWPDVALMVENLMASRCFLFAGASLEGIVADLAAIGVRPLPQPPGEFEPPRHWAIAGVGAGWEQTAAILFQRYGIAVLACDAETISGDLPSFLETTARLCAGRTQNNMLTAREPAERPAVMGAPSPREWHD
jgi:hypothetical protein